MTAITLIATARCVCFAGLLGSFTGTISATAAEAPRALFNRSVTLTWDEYRVQRCDSGETSRGNTSSILQVYISGEGRPFARLHRQGGGGRSNSTDTDPEGGESSKGQGASRLDTHFQDQQLLIDTPMRSGARRIQVSFDAGFSSCTVEVRFGKEGGRDLYHRTMDGRMCTILSTDVSGRACTIKSGNAFAER